MLKPEEGIMKRSVIFLFIAILVSMLSGCILSKTPSTNDVAIPSGEHMTFSVNVFPPGGTYVWTLDDAPLTNPGNSYLYTATAGNHTLVVKAKHFLGTDTQTWNIITPESTYDISGTVALSGGGVLQGVTITLSGTSSGTATTDASGNYSFIDLVNGSYTVIPSLAGYTFNPISQALTVNGANATAINFIATAISNDPVTQLLNSLVTIPAGSFMMGSTDNQYGYAQYTTPVHQVTLQAFDIGKYEVTQAQYQAVMGVNPSYFQGTSYPNTGNNPVEQVSWYDARAFCTALSALTGRTFTLPSEAQWEYACRAGTTTLYSYGDSDALLGDYAWWWANSDGTGGPYGTHPVGTKLSNNWGLYDMMGNVWEWCLDSWHNNYTGAPTDGSAWEPETGSYRLIRGGGWHNDIPWAFRSAYRNNYGTPGGRSNIIGFRVLAVR